MDFSKIFNEMLHEHSLFFLGCLTVAFLIGLLTAWWARSFSLRKQRQANRELAEEKFHLEIENEQSNEKQLLYIAQLKQSRDEYDSLNVARRKLELEKNQALTELHALKSSLHKAEQDAQFAQEELLALKNNYLESSKQLAAGLGLSEDSLDRSQSEIAQLKAALAASKALLEKMGYDPDQEEVDFVANPPALDGLGSGGDDELLLNAQAAIEAKGFYTDIDGDGLIDDPVLVDQQIEQDLLVAQESPVLGNVDLHVEGLSESEKMQIKQILHDQQIPIEALEDDEQPEAPSQERGPDKEQATQAVKAAIGTRIPSALETSKDDLKRINGIGPFIERKLNELGIYRFEQLAALDDELCNLLTDAIEFFPGRIQRDNWVGQARAYSEES